MSAGKTAGMDAGELAIRRAADGVRKLTASDLGQALQAAKRACAQWPGSQLLQLLKAEIFVLRDNAPAAHKALEAAMGCPPGELKTRVRLARLAATLGRYEAAQALVEAALQEGPGPDQAIQLAIRLADIGDYQGALDALARTGLAGDPFAEVVRCKLAADVRAGVDAEHKRLWSKAMELLRRGQPERAEPRLEELTRRAPGYAPGWIGLRGALAAQGGDEAARAVRAAWSAAAPGAGALVAAGMGRRLSPRGLLFDPRQSFGFKPKAKALAPVDSPEALQAAGQDAVLTLDPGGQAFRHAPAFAFDRLHPSPIEVETVAPESFLAVLHHPLLVGRGLPVTADGSLIKELTSPGLDKSDLRRAPDGVAFDWRRFRDGLCPVRCFDEPAFLMVGPHDNGFGDWMLNYPPRLVLAEAARLDCRIVVAEKTMPTAEPMLAALGIDPARLVRHDASGVSLFPRLYVPSWPMPRRLQHVADLFAVYRRAARPPPAKRPRLYLSREGMGRRPLLNEPQVRALFERRGFRAIQPERMRFEDALELFAGPACVAAPYGSALLNLAFATTRPPCLVIAPPEPELFLKEAISWLGAMQLPFGYVRGEPGPGEAGEGWTAPLELVERGLEALLALEA